MDAIDAWLSRNETLVLVSALLSVIVAISFVVSFERRARLAKRHCHDLAGALIASNTRNEQALRVVRDLLQMSRRRA